MRITKRINFFYNLKQIINKLQAQKLTKFSIEDNLFILNNKQTKIKSILLYLDDEKRPLKAIRPDCRNLTSKLYNTKVKVTI